MMLFFIVHCSHTTATTGLLIVDGAMTLQDSGSRPQVAAKGLAASACPGLEIQNETQPHYVLEHAHDHPVCVCVLLDTKDRAHNAHTPGTLDGFLSAEMVHMLTIDKGVVVDFIFVGGGCGSQSYLICLVVTDGLELVSLSILDISQSQP